MDPSRFKIEWFKNSNGESPKSQEELKIMFDNYRWPMLIDLWMPIASAVLIGVCQSIFISNMK